MSSALAQEAINSALAGNWLKAIDDNLKILKITPTDVDALNRIARAYAETGDLVKAERSTKKVLKIDPINPIANRCTGKWKSYTKQNHTTTISPDVFIENLARTKIINLINLGDSKNLLSLDCGNIVKLNASEHRISVSSRDDKYIGRFPDDLASRYIKLMKTETYDAVIKSIDKTQAKILIKQTS
jgi:tetratricopeptide (TPR) repeat protein